MSRNRPKKMRVPSRPVDQRHRPRAYVAPRRRGLDPFAIGLIGVSTAFVLVIILLVLLSNRGGSTSSNNTPSQPGSTAVTGSASQTQQAIALSTELAAAPRIRDADLKAFID